MEHGIVLVAVWCSLCNKIVIDVRLLPIFYVGTVHTLTLKGSKSVLFA